MRYRAITSEPQFRDELYFAKCPLLNKEATITARYYGTKWTPSDLQFTYRLSGTKCSLGSIGDSCHAMGRCPVNPPEYL